MEVRRKDFPFSHVWTGDPWGHGTVLVGKGKEGMGSRVPGPARVEGLPGLPTGQRVESATQDSGEKRSGERVPFPGGSHRPGQTTGDQTSPQRSDKHGEKDRVGYRIEEGSMEGRN